MPHRKFSGKILISRSAKIETDQGLLTLIPYPKGAPIAREEMEWVGRELFAYLKNKEAEVVGELSGKRIFNAHLAPSRLAIKDFTLTPQSKDRFSQEIEQYFKRDSRQIASKLNNAGIVTVSAFYHRIKNFEPEVQAFSDYLKVPEDSIKKFVKAIEQDHRNRSLVTAPPKVPVTRGVNLSVLRKVTGVPVKRRASTAPSPFPASARTRNLPSKVDLTKHITRVKDQGVLRGTCVAHTAAAFMEYQLINRGPYRKTLDLSEQYLYWACKQIDGEPNGEGTFIEYAVEVLKNGVPSQNLGPGVCKEADWDYEPGNATLNPPPRKAVSAIKSKGFKAANYIKLDPNSIKDLKMALANNHCVGLSVYTYHFWTDGYAWREGIISLPFRIKPDGAHAICLVGYEDSDATHTDGYFIFKNSWGTNWGIGRPDPGYGSLPYRYVLTEGIEAWFVEL